MKIKKKYFILVIICLAALVFFLRNQHSKRHADQMQANEQATPREITDWKDVADNDSVPPVADELTKEMLAKIKKSKTRDEVKHMQQLLKKSYSKRIDFWGKVIDLKGNPIPNATATITVNSYSGNKDYIIQSDSHGLFQLLAKRGGEIQVKIEADGYAPTSNSEIGVNISRRTIYYSTEAMPYYSPPTPNNPQIFVLRKMNPVANVSHFVKRNVPIAIDGSAQIIDVGNEDELIKVEIRCWSDAPVPFTYEKYDWRAQIKILDGKLQPITEPDPVDAPAKDYHTLYSLEMPKDMEGNWIRSSPNGARDFWIQFNDHTYAKSRIEIKTGRKNEANLEFWYNLDGTNNFEQ